MAMRIYFERTNMDKELSDVVFKTNDPYETIREKFKEMEKRLEKIENLMASRLRNAENGVFTTYK